jgi:hypothetical protein
VGRQREGRVHEGDGRVHEATGIKVDYTTARDFDAGDRTRLAAGNPPESRSSRAGRPRDLAKQGAVKDLEPRASKSYLTARYSRRGSSSAPSTGRSTALPAKANSKSVVWYRPISSRSTS